MVLEQLDIHMQKKRKKKNSDLELTAFTKISSTWIRGLNVKGKTIKLKNNTGENLDDLEFGDDFLDMTPKIQSMKEKMDRLGLIKINSFCSAKKHCQENENAGHRQGEVFPNVFLIILFFLKLKSTLK